MVLDKETLFVLRTIPCRLSIAVEPSLEEINLVHRRWDELYTLQNLGFDTFAANLLTIPSQVARAVTVSLCPRRGTLLLTSDTSQILLVTFFSEYFNERSGIGALSAPGLTRRHRPRSPPDHDISMGPLCRRHSSPLLPVDARHTSRLVQSELQHRSDEDSQCLTVQHVLPGRGNYNL
jgi:hypothetical protein